MLDETNDASQTENKSSVISLQNETTRDSHVLISTRSFKDFLLKPELLRAITDYGFEHPSEVQQESIPQAILGTDIICQAKSGMGKTAIFILATVQQLEPIDGRISVIVLCHTRELAFNIGREYERFCKYMPAVKVSTFYDGVTIKIHEDILKNNCPHIVVGTPGRILALAKSKALNLHYVKHFIIDQCDTLLESLDIRRDVQEIFKMTPHEKQVFMCTSLLNKEILPLCKKFTRDPMELIYTDNVSKLTLHGLRQYYIKLHEDEKNQKLIDLLGKLEFNQTVIFVKSVSRCNSLCQLLIKENFPAIEIHQEMTQEQRLTCYKEFQDFQKRILVTTNLLRGSMNIQHIIIVLNYDIPKDTDTYLYRVGNIGHSGTKGLAITFISDESDAAILNEIQRRFEIHITEIPNEIYVATYLKKC